MRTRTYIAVLSVMFIFMSYDAVARVRQSAADKRREKERQERLEQRRKKKESDEGNQKADLLRQELTAEVDKIKALPTDPLPTSRLTIDTPSEVDTAFAL